jgi:hypothetical protein
MRTFILLALAGLGAQLVDGIARDGLRCLFDDAAVIRRGRAGAGVGGGSHRGGRDDGGVGYLARLLRERGLVEDRLDGDTWRHRRFLGASALVWASTLEATAGYVEPVVAIFLFSLGVYVLARFAFRRNERPVNVRPVSRQFLAPLGLFAGFLDAMGGGGWGPISTPTLLSSGRMEPRKVIGTVDTSEFVVALCASLGFLFSLSFAQIPWQVVGALLAGGLVAAPIAAWIVKMLRRASSARPWAASSCWST